MYGNLNSITSSINKINSITQSFQKSIRPFTAISEMYSPVFETSKLHSEIIKSYTGLGLASSHLTQIGAITKAFQESIKPFTAISEISKLHSERIKSYTGLGLASSHLTQIGAITKAFQESIKPFTTISEMYSPIFETSKLHSEIIKSYSGLGLTSSHLTQIGSISKAFQESVLSNNMSILNSLTKQLEYDIEDIKDIESIDIDNSLKMVESFKVEIIDSLKHNSEDIYSKKLQEIESFIRNEKNPVIYQFIIPIIVSLISAIIFTYYLMPIIENVKEGYTSSQIKKELKQGLKQTIPNQTELKKYRIVKATILNTRQKPNIKSKIIYHLSFGDIVEIIRKEKNWCLIRKYDSENETIIQGWTNTKYLVSIK